MITHTYTLHTYTHTHTHTQTYIHIHTYTQTTNKLYVVSSFRGVLFQDIETGKLFGENQFLTKAIKKLQIASLNQSIRDLIKHSNFLSKQME